MLDYEEIYAAGGYSYVDDFTGDYKEGLQLIRRVTEYVRSKDDACMIAWRILAMGRILGIREERKRNATRKKLRNVKFF